MHRETTNKTEGETNSSPGVSMRAFPWLATALFIGAAAIAISLLQAETPNEFAAAQAVTPSVPVTPSEAQVSAIPPSDEIADEALPSTTPASPYADLQSQIVPRDLKSIHEGGTVGLYSIDAVQDEAAFCDESHWAGASFVKQVGTGQVFVDREDWQNAPVSTRAQMASWMSKCTQQGHRVEILGQSSGRLLATYHPREGLTPID